MIPKIIHYCWFGGGEKTPLINKCIETWKKYCPDYQIIEWNETNFDININTYVMEAYQYKKYAFVSDYLRLYALMEFGGIYVDCDLEIRKNIDKFLNDRAFSSFESKNYIPTAIMGAEKGHPWIKELLQYYKGKTLITKDNLVDKTTNTQIITDITKEKFGLELSNKEQIIADGIHIYPDYYFCVNKLNSKNYSIHHFSGSWLDKEDIEDISFKLKYKKNYFLLTCILDKLEEKCGLEFCLNNYKNVYLFGAGSIAKYLVKYFDEMQYDIKGIISREDSKKKIYGKKVIGMDNIGEFTTNDLIIVTPSYDFNYICDELSKKTSAELVEIDYVLDLTVARRG